MKPRTTERSASQASKLMCACFQITMAEIHAHMSEPGATVESLVEKTGIGTKCTACLLDLDLALSEFVAAGTAAEAALALSRRDWKTAPQAQQRQQDLITKISVARPAFTKPDSAGVGRSVIRIHLNRATKRYNNMGPAHHA